jgi:hypothetical protein
LKALKSKAFKSFSDEAYGFITCGAEPPHKVNVNVNVNVRYPAAFDPPRPKGACFKTVSPRIFMWTTHTPKTSGNGNSGFFAKHAGRAVFIDDLSADWLRAKAAANNTTPEDIIGEMVRKEIVAGTTA